jgi:phage terminase small subunit
MVVALNEKQQRFADEYLIDLNATQAAIRSGYSEKTAKQQGSRLLSNVDIKAYIDARMAEKKQELIADQDEVLTYLTNVLRGKSQSEIVVVESIGDFMSEARRIQKAPDEKERLKAAELLGKRYNLFSDKMKVDVALPVVISGGEDLAD